MFALFTRALLLWLTLFELIAVWRRWWGLSWLGSAAPRGLLLPLLAALQSCPWVAVQPSSGRTRTNADERGKRHLVRVRPRAARIGGSSAPNFGHSEQLGRWIVCLVLALPPALLLQIITANWRNPLLNPLLRLRPGRYAHYTIERLDIPMREGPLPALHVVPHAGATAVVCVLHGSGCDKTSYAWRLVDTLAERGLALLLIDMDGHGENPRAQSFPAITENAAVAVAWLRDRYARVGLLGVSLGGCVAARVVADGVAVDALVVLEAPPLLRYTQADTYREAIALLRPYLLDIFNDCTVQALIKAWEYPPIRATISTWDLIAALDVAGSLTRAKAPLLLIYGTSDAIVKPDQAAQAWAALPAQATFHLLPGVSHLTMLLTPQALHIIGEWLEKILIIDQPRQTFH